MHPSLAPVAGIVQLDTGLFEKAVAGLDRDGLIRPVVAQANPLGWIAGHVVSARFLMATLLGETRTAPWGATFGRGATLPDPTTLPQVDEFLTTWREISGILVARLGEATEAQLAATSPRALPMADKTVLGALTFLAYHEGYHMGQMALIRRALGMPGLVDA